MNDVIKQYDILAKHYDAAYAVYTLNQVLVDVPFYVDLARRSGGPVLEIACGTGRVLLPIAREGFEIDGVDNSLRMLDVLKTRLAGEAAEVRQRVALREGDMRSFRMERKYALVIIPFRSMQHMYTLQDQLDALATAAFHLRDEGKFAFDVSYPKLESIRQGIGEEFFHLEWAVEADPTLVTRRYFRREFFDKIHQNVGGTFTFRTYRDDKLIAEESEPLKMSYYTYPQLRALFLLAGLEVVEEYGSFAKAPLDNAAEQMIFVLQRVKRRNSR